MSPKKVKPVIYGWCMKCKESRRMRGGNKTMMKNGRLAYKGVCWDCGCKMHKILSKTDIEKLS